MFGVFRFFLATLVVMSHLASGYAPFSYYGFYAVFGFYCLSGYLMTSVLNERYKFTVRGSRSFWVNRILRIFPSYYVVAALTLVLIILFPLEASHHHSAYALPLQPMDALGNILLFPFALYQPHFRLVPPSWSIGVELLAYFLIWIFIARGKWRAHFSLIVSFAYIVYTFWAGLNWVDRYFPLLAALLPFTLGSLLYHYHDSIGAWLQVKNGYLLAVSILALVLNLILASRIDGYPLGWGFYVNLALMVFVIAQLSTLKKSVGWLAKLDGFIGELSYPLFLVHTVAGFVVSLFFTPQLQYGLQLLVIGFPVSVVASIFIRTYVDIPVNKLRDRNRVDPPDA